MSLRSKYQGNLEKSMRGNEVQNNKSEKKMRKCFQWAITVIIVLNYEEVI